MMNSKPMIKVKKLLCCILESPKSHRGLFLFRRNKKNQSFIKQSQGGALIQVLVMCSFMSIIFYSMTQGIFLQKKQYVLTKEKASSILILNSFMEFLHTSVKNNWCINGSSFLPDMRCSLAHARSTERVIMSRDTYNIIKTMLENGMNVKGLSSPSQLKPLSCIDGKVDLDSLSPKHTLKNIVNTYQVGALKFKEVKYRINRYKNEHSGTMGQTVLNANIKLDYESAQGGKSIYLNSLIGIMPRELNNFGLIVANDLHLDKSFSSISLGDANIHTYSHRSSFRGRGLIFESPVFVNGSVYLPNHPVGSPPPYSPVTFSNKIVLGDGKVMQGTLPYHPRHHHQTWNDNPYFGGFLKGVDIDGKRDIGLDYFSGKHSRSLSRLVASQANMQKCLQHQMIEIDLNQTIESQLRLRSSSSRNHYLQLTGGNKIVPQTVGTEGRVDMKNPSGIYDMTVTPSYSESTEKIARLKINLNGNEISANLPESGELMIQFKAKSSVIADIDTKIAQQQSRSLASVLPAVTSSIQKNIEDLTALKNKYLTGPPSIRLKTSLHSLGEGSKDLSSFHLKVDFTNKDDLTSHLTSDLQIDVEPFDIGYLKGINKRVKHMSGYDRQGTLNYGVTLRNPTSLSYSSPQKTSHPYQVTKLSEDLALKTACAGDTSYNGAFDLKDWALDFAPFTRASWSLTQDISAPNTFLLNENNSVPLPNRSIFFTVSIGRRCVVQDGATFVTGFFICDEFVIEPRRNPLKIIATVITSRLQIHPSALEAGIQWFNVHHATVTPDLRRTGILSALRGAPCVANHLNPQRPIWHPYPGLIHTVNNYRCNTIFLRKRVEPLQWTTVDPDCGVLPGETLPTCKREIKRFHMIEFMRYAPTNPEEGDYKC